MKIALVIKHFDPARGGAEHWTWQYAQWLLGRGHEVHVVASSLAEGSGPLGVVPHLVPDLRSPLCWADAAADVADAVRADVVHDMGAGWHCDVFQPHGGSRVASFEHNLLLLPRWLRPLKRLSTGVLPRYREFRRLMARQYAADGRRVIALSRMVAEHMRQFHDVPADRLRLVYNGVDIERFSPDTCRPHRAAVRQRLGLRDEALLLIVAHNYRLKGVSTLLRAVGRLRRAGRAVCLAVAGGKRSRAYERLADRLGIAPYVTFLGPQRDVVPFYAAADVYVQPTFYDPCSLVVLEAMACGLPVVTSRYNGAGELITAGLEGSVVSNPADDQELAQSLGPLLDPAQRERSGIAARRRAESHSWDRNCREIVALYTEMGQRRDVRRRDARLQAA
jgi:UDP-glucose:(heptosyl)LPS alpha-1,3-glucosyltransferase